MNVTWEFTTKGGSNAHSRTSIFDVSHDYVKKVVPERKLADVIFLKLILTSYRSRTLVRINFHQHLHPKPHYALDIPNVVIGSIYGLTLSKVYFKHFSKFPSCTDLMYTYRLLILIALFMIR